MASKIILEQRDGTLHWVYRNEIHDVGSEGKRRIPFVDILRPSGIVSRMQLSADETPAAIYAFWMEGQDAP